MKPSSAAILVSLALIPFWLLLNGCSQGPEQTGVANATDNAQMLIEPRTAVGKIRAGMTLQQVVAELGQPGSRTSNALEYPKLGLAVMPGPDDVVQVVMCGDVTGINGPFVAAFKGHTKEGIGMNSTRADVLKAFGEPTQDEKMKLGLESLQYSALGLTLTLDGGKVHHMIVRLGTNTPVSTIEVTPVR